MVSNGQDIGLLYLDWVNTLLPLIESSESGEVSVIKLFRVSRLKLSQEISDEIFSRPKMP